MTMQIVEGKYNSAKVFTKDVDADDAMEFKAEMEGIWSTTVSMDTIDESPMAYKTMDSIVQNIGPTADVVTVIKPVYNFKASDEPPWKDRRGRKGR